MASWLETPVIIGSYWKRYWSLVEIRMFCTLPILSHWLLKLGALESWSLKQWFIRAASSSTCFFWSWLFVSLEQGVKYSTILMQFSALTLMDMKVPFVPTFALYPQCKFQHSMWQDKPWIWKTSLSHQNISEHVCCHGLV